MKPHIVVLSGAGISAESGLKTFRDSGGLWENHHIEDVATPEAWHRNRALVLRFYNDRRKAMHEARPNPGHLEIAFERFGARTVEDAGIAHGEVEVGHACRLGPQARPGSDRRLVRPGWGGGFVVSCRATGPR